MSYQYSRVSACLLCTISKMLPHVHKKLQSRYLASHNKISILCLLLLLHPFNGLSARTTWVSQHQKGKPFWILLEQEMMRWRWHQLDHMQIICTSLQITMQVPHHSSFYSPDAFLPPNQQHQSTEGSKVFDIRKLQHCDHLLIQKC